MSDKMISCIKLLFNFLLVNLNMFYTFFCGEICLERSNTADGPIIVSLEYLT